MVARLGTFGIQNFLDLKFEFLRRETFKKALLLSVSPMDFESNTVLHTGVNAGAICDEAETYT